MEISTFVRNFPFVKRRRVGRVLAAFSGSAHGSGVRVATVKMLMRTLKLPEVK